MAVDSADARPSAIVVPDSFGILPPEEDEGYLNVLVYGVSGAGKTVLCGSFADDERSAPVLYMDAENGRQSIRWRMHRKLPDGQYALQVKEMTNFTRDYGTLARFINQTLDAGQPLPWKTIALDSMSQIAKQAMDSVLAKSGHAKREYSDWEAWTRVMQDFVDFFRYLPCHVIMTALQETNDFGETVPLLPGKKLAQDIGQFYGTVGWLHTVAIEGPNHKRVSERRLLLESDPRYVAKDRTNPTGGLPAELANPTATALLDRLAEGQRLATAQFEE